MNKLYTNKIFNLVLLITIIGEFLLPFILKHFYRGYDSKTMVMSVLGSPESPVRSIYNIWLIWLGIFLLFTSFVFFSEIKKTSAALAVMIFISVSVFAVGAGVLSGIFSVNESKEVTFVTALILFVFFIMGDKEEFKETVFSYSGLWERSSLFFMYIPFLYRAVKNLSAAF